MLRATGGGSGVGVGVGVGLDRLGAGRGRADDVDVALEAEELREVVARLGDIVDDQDTDLVGHLGLGYRLCCVAYAARARDPVGPTRPLRWVMGGGDRRSRWLAGLRRQDRLDQLRR